MTLPDFAAPFRAVRSWFPFTHDGRQTLIYLVFALAGPALTGIALWVMRAALANERWSTFEQMAWVIGGCLLIVCSGLGMFVSIRSIKMGKDGFEASGGNDE